MINLKCGFHFERTKLDKNERRWGIPMSFRFGTGMMKVKISGVLVSLHIMIRLK